MRLIVFAAAATIAIALPALAQSGSAPSDSGSTPPSTVGSGTAKALETNPDQHMVGKPVSPSAARTASHRHKSSASQSDATPKPNSSTGPNGG